MGTVRPGCEGAKVGLGMVVGYTVKVLWWGWWKQRGYETVKEGGEDDAWSRFR